MAIPTDLIRSHFPALDSGAVFFDNPGGTQVPHQVMVRMTDYLTHCNANHGGVFATTRASDALISEARNATADFLGAASCRNIVFGANMTTLTFHFSRSLAKILQPGDEIIVTRLDHDANIAPWLLLAADCGAVVRWVDIHPVDCTLDLTGYASLLSSRTKLVAIGYASNAVGTINDVRSIISQARAVGALTFVDAVQYAPHGPIDVQELGCDMLACSAYKFFGPHVGILFATEQVLGQLSPYKVRPASDDIPYRWETGTLNHEGLAGLLGTMEYLSGLPDLLHWTTGDGSRRQRLLAAMVGIRRLENELCSMLITGLQAISGLKIWGISSPDRVVERVPTVAFTMVGHAPRVIAEKLAESGIYVWDGHYYAQAIMERLGLLEQGGMVRIGLAHYNTRHDIDRLLAVLHAIAGTTLS
jgi:cysteine desulfurase family protein (TIGR01976 family)